MAAPVLRGSAPIAEYAIPPQATLASAAIQNDLDSTNSLEGGLDLGEEERAIGGHDCVLGVSREPLPRATGTDAVADP